jgi:hypothetical protein
MFDKSDYLRFRKRGPNCAACGKPFDQEEKHSSVLVEEENETLGDAEAVVEAPEPTPAAAKPTTKKDDAPEEESGYNRYDYCEKCWEEIKDKAFFSFWVGKPNESNLPPRKLNRAERNMALVALFDSLAERSGSENDYTPHLFFLAHLLMKYRIFKWQPADTDARTGQKTLRFTRSDSEDPVLLPEVDLPDEMILKIKDEIESYLQQSTGQPVRL